MKTRALFPGGGFLLSLLLAGLILLHSDLRAVADKPVGVRSGGWVSVVEGEGAGRFHRIVRDEVFRDFLKREIPDWCARLSESCLNETLSAGMCIRLSIGQGSREAACVFSPLPERHRYLMGMPMDLNRAGKKDLVLLPRIGNVMADRILKSRQARGRFLTMEDLQAVHGIGRKTVERLRRHAKVGP